MRPDLPRKLSFWPEFAFLLYWPTMAVFMLALAVVGGELLRPTMTLIAGLSVVVFIVGLAWLVPRRRRA